MKISLLAGIVFATAVAAHASGTIEEAYGSAAKTMANKAVSSAAMPSVVAFHEDAPQSIVFYGFGAKTTDAKACQAMAVDLKAKLAEALAQRNLVPDVFSVEPYIPAADCRGMEPMRICYYSPCGVTLKSYSALKWTFGKDCLHHVPGMPPKGPEGIVIDSQMGPGGCLQTVELATPEAQ